MKRMILEWGLILGLGTSLALLTLWVVTRFFDRLPYHFRISTTGNVQHDLHLILYDGQFALSNHFNRDSSGRVRPLIVEARTLNNQDKLRGDWCGRVTIPGLDLAYYWNPLSCGLVWSVVQSLLIPVVVFLSLAARFRSRLSKLKASTSRNMLPDLEGQTDSAGACTATSRCAPQRTMACSTRSFALEQP